ncbi:peroxiredoxin [candidate division GN15 bacterium]|nr:peroxiredoxin [candidate division GN15 bacterium]
MEVVVHRLYLIALVSMAVLLIGCGTPANNVSAPVQDGVLVHITAGPDNPHRVLMGLQMAVKMSEDKAVAVYLDIDAVNVFVNGAADIELEPFPSAFTQLETLAGKNVAVMACPGCLGVAGISPDSLMTGVTVADKDRFFDFADGRIVTLDY